jgi:hypothetical protein
MLGLQLIASAQRMRGHWQGPSASPLTTPNILRVVHRLTEPVVCLLPPLRRSATFPERRAFMATRIYVGNLPYSATSDQLTNLFSAFGEVSEATIVMDRETGRAKGFAFVQMANEDAARTAIAQLDGTTLDNRAIRVNEAQARPARGDRYGNGDRPARW